jgi:hypothetical protein
MIGTVALLRFYCCCMRLRLQPAAATAAATADDLSSCRYDTGHQCLAQHVSCTTDLTAGHLLTCAAAAAVTAALHHECSQHQQWLCTVTTDSCWYATAVMIHSVVL